ncbi:MAG: two-component system response regulator [Cycloclasticus sp. symbiont of Bathymodiolus heckerae]|nr:MAG: two-component system response regulator [Cycloclasticus sp. symbiont of Bathymodiolus heckerae]
MTESKVRMLIIDDDEVYCDVLKSAFKKRGFDVKTASNEEQAVQQIGSFDPELAVVDLRLEQSSGLHLIKCLKDNDESTKVVMLTGYASIATAVEAVKLGAIQYITKPANADEILAAFSMDKANSEVALSEHPLSVKRLEWEYLQKTLMECSGNVSEAARQLNMHRRTLQRKLAKRPVRQ